MTRRSLLVLGLLLLCGTPSRAQVAPDEEWRTFDTEHFRVTYPAALEPLARRAGEEAERAFEALRESFVEAPGGTIELVVTDHVDFTNGFADLTPWKGITVFARPPVDGFALIYFDDWLELVITHELAHVFHLDKTGALGSVVRAVFGRVPAPWPVFPGRSLPDWAIEGLATYYESALTRSGRIKGTFHEMMLRTAVLEGGFEELDQASGVSPVWPAGDRPYLWGSRFFDHLAERHGAEGMEAFARAVASQVIPYRLNAAGEAAFGTSFSRAWSRWRDSLKVRYRALADTVRGRGALTRSRSLSHRGRFALYPRPGPEGDRVAWSHSDGVNDPQIRIADPEGSGARKLTRTNGLGNFSWHPGGGLVLDQLEFRDPYRIRRDLYRVDRGGEVRSITRGARVSQPDVHPSGDRVVAVQDGQGTNRLVLVELEDGGVTPLTSFRPGVHWAYPRWSPDGRWVAVGKWESGAYYDVVVLDGKGRESLRITRDRAVDLSPAWSSRGDRLLWSSDRTGIPNVFGVEVDPARGRKGPVRQVTNFLTGAWYPAVDPLGRWIYLSVYHADGWHVERIPFEPERWFDPFPTDPRFQEGEGPGVGSAEGGSPRHSGAASAPEAPGREYSALPTLLPRYWEPLFEPGREVGGREVIDPMVGALTSGRDLVGRHRYSIWARVEPDEDRRVEASASYAFAGLGNPVLGLSGSQLHDALGRFSVERPDTAGVVDTVYVTERERRVGASLTIRRPRMRSAFSATISASWIREERRVLDQALKPSSRYRPAVPRSDLGQGALTLSYANARRHAFSVSSEDGMEGFIRFRGRRHLGLESGLSGSPGDDRGFDEVTGRLGLFKSVSGPGFANHVLAVRLSGGAARGPGADRFHFDVGGASGRSESLTGFGLFGGIGLLFPVRGYRRDYRSGRYAWSGSLEYRVPLATVHRGLGSVPFYLDRVSVGTFLDGGDAWGPEGEFAGLGPNPRSRVLWSVGAELLASTVPLWATVLDLRAGIAFPRVGEGGSDLYLRLGWSF